MLSMFLCQTTLNYNLTFTSLQENKENQINEGD